MFVPLAGERAETFMAWHPARDRQAVRNLRDVAAELAATIDLTEAG